VPLRPKQFRLAKSFCNARRLAVRLAYLGLASAFGLSQALAEARWIGARIGAVDVDATAQFYSACFSLNQINRLAMDGGVVEIFLQPAGSEVTTSSTKLVVMSRESDDLPPSLPPWIFQVTDLDGTLECIAETGGTVTRQPFQFGESGITIAVAKDPAGNRVEIIAR
jgi:predicted enzyme related to lactoylglutathione lyase